jgi:filamentous hemagglutinin
VGSGSGKQKADDAKPGDAKPGDAKPDPKGMQVQAFQTGMNGAAAGIGSASGNKGGTTRSGISAGTLSITDDKKQTALTGKSAEQTVAATNRDVVSGKDSGAVAKDWNGQKLKEEVTAQAQITQAFSPMAAKEIGTYAGNKEKEAKDNAEAAGKAGDTAREAEFNAEAAKWAEGGAYRVALHAAAGGVAGGVGGALGAGASAAAAREIDKLQEGAQKYLEQVGMKPDSAQAVAKGVAGATAAGIGAVAGGTAGAAVGMNVDVNNRQLHEKESKNLARLKQGRDKAAKDRLDDAMCALAKCSAGVPDSDPLKAELAASEQRGRSYKDEQDLIKQAGAFDGYSTHDQINDFLLSRDEGIRRAQGVAQGVAGGAGVAGGVALAGTGAATCAPTAGGGCAVAALGGVIAVKSAESGLDGFRTAVGPYQSTEGQRVKDSFDLETYPGERDRAAELGMDGARSALGYGLGKLAGRLAAGPAPVKGETSVATTASKAENELLSGRESPAVAKYNDATKRTEEDLSVLDQKAATHILDGDGPTSGGHRYGTGTPGKSEFPKSWSDQKIRNIISDIATDPAVEWSKPDSRGYVSGTARREGVDIKVVYDTKNNRIVTGYPTNLLKNPK